MSVLQLAPFVEMVDKLGDGVCWGLREDDTASVQSLDMQRAMVIHRLTINTMMKLARSNTCQALLHLHR